MYVFFWVVARGLLMERGGKTKKKCIRNRLIFHFVSFVTLHWPSFIHSVHSFIPSPPCRLLLAQATRVRICAKLRYRRKTSLSRRFLGPP